MCGADVDLGDDPHPNDFLMCGECDDSQYALFGSGAGSEDDDEDDDEDGEEGW